MRKVSIQTFPMTPDAAVYERESVDSITSILIVGSLPVAVKFITKKKDDNTLYPPNCHSRVDITDPNIQRLILLWIGDNLLTANMSQESLDHLLLY